MMGMEDVLGCVLGTQVAVTSPDTGRLWGYGATGGSALAMCLGKQAVLGHGYHCPEHISWKQQTWI